MRRQKRTCQTVRRLCVEHYESRVMLSGDGLIHLADILGDDSYNNHRLAFIDSDSGTAQWFLFSDAGDLDAVPNTAVQSTADFSFDQWDATLSDYALLKDTDVTVFGSVDELKGMLQTLPMKPLAGPSTPAASEAGEVIAMSSLLREDSAEETSLAARPLAPSGQHSNFAANDLAIQHLAARNTAPHWPAPNPTPADLTHLDRSWSIELAVTLPAELPIAPGLSTPVNPTTPSTQEAPPDKPPVVPIPSQSAVAAPRPDALPDSHFFDEAVAVEPADPPSSALHLTTAQQDAAFAGWTGHAEVRRNAVIGTVLALLAASRIKATSPDPEENQQRGRWWGKNQGPRS